MALTNGTHLGPYEILQPIGAGGMGQVYKARDTRLNRTVAIKVLPPEFATRPDWKQRFEREAQTIASLNHPHICTLHDVGQQDGIDYLVMEFLEGQTLAQRLERGALQLDEALKIAIEIGDALDKAHRQGIVHRDLKPANVMLTKTGVKLLDFGLAKPTSLTGQSGASALPTAGAEVTGQGLILGTLQYMAPEQFEGGAADARTDIFAFGAVLYETVTGRKAFEGKSQASLIAAIMRADPPAISAIQPEAPSALAHVIRFCLAKDPADRWQTAHDVRLQLVGIREAGSQVAAAHTATSQRRREMVTWSMAALAIVIAAIGLITAFRRPAVQEPAVVRFNVPPPQRFFINGGFPEIAVSPDGRYLAIGALDNGVRKLWLRAIDSTEMRLMPGTEGADLPFWSPDSRYIGFNIGRDKLKKIAINGASPELLTDMNGGGGTWNRDGIIVYTAFSTGNVYRISSTGGTPTQVTSLSPGENGHNHPVFLPDGRHFLFWIPSEQPEIRGVYVGSLDSKEKKRIFDFATRTFYSAGHLLWVRNEKLMAQEFDTYRLETRGLPFVVAEGVAQHGFSVSDAGILAYGSSSSSYDDELTWFDRTGRRLGTIGQGNPGNQIRLSPDGSHVVVVRSNFAQSTSDLWLGDISRPIFSRFTFGPNRAISPVWSPDAQQIAFTSNRKDEGDLYVRSVRSGQEEALLEISGTQLIDDWSRDGRYIIFHDGVSTASGSDRTIRGGVSSAYALSLTDRKPSLLLRDSFAKGNFVVSPDGHWIAYQSDESGDIEVHVAAFPSMSERRQVSNTGGGLHRWRGDGKELYYISSDRKLMAVDMTGLQNGVPKSLFQLQSNGYFDVSERFDVTADGQRFLLLQPLEQISDPPLTVVINWLAAIEKNSSHR